MDTFSSNEDLITKTRKPYTITKQRERWTAEEHTRFLEAIKLYGRAWQRIEEHIGTKTAVQIRSHAQKFFSKLEKEALIKGALHGPARDIDIPPPRPKRKPNNPYPRKNSSGTPNYMSVDAKDGSLLPSASLQSGELTQDVDNDVHLEKPCKRRREKEDFDEDNRLGILALSQETPCTSLSPASTSGPASGVLKKQCVLKAIIPSVKATSDEGVMDDFSLKRTDTNLNNCCHKMDVKVIKGVKLQQAENLCLLPNEEIQANQNYPRHIPVHVLESSSETCTECPSVVHKVKSNNFTKPLASACTENRSNMSVEQSLPNFPPPLNHDGSYNMFVNTNFSNLIVSTLLQNPAAHAAASFASAFWPFTNVKTPVDSPLGTIGGFQLRHGGPSPSASAIAAATVMAASAWWAAHGMLPLCPPFNPGFTFLNAPSDPPAADVSPVLVETEKKDEKLEDAGLPKDSELESPGHEQKPVSIKGSQEPDKGKAKVQVDRSSCGSNTPSSSEIEMDILEKHGNGNDEPKEHNNVYRASEPTNHRSRSTGSMNDSWREVSEEGKLAFKALFSREILPQSFSPPKYVGNNGQLMKSDGELIIKSDDLCEEKLHIDLNSQTLLTCKENCVHSIELCIGCGHEKLKDRQTGFKPYKRCLVEAKESRVVSASSQGEERDSKRVWLEGEASR